MAIGMTADADQLFDQEGRVTVPDVSTRFDFLACRFAHRRPGPPSFASVGLRIGPYHRKDWLAGRVVDVTRRRRST